MVKTVNHILILVAPVRERGLKFEYDFRGLSGIDVAPVRERGLKFWSTNRWT